MSQRARKQTVLFTGLLLFSFYAVCYPLSIDLVTVGNPDNPPDPRYPGGFGSVGYEFKIEKYEITAGQYTAFLNAVAANDPYGLYDPRMDTASDSYGCNIKRGGVSSVYGYSVPSDWADRPVNYVSWGDAVRFVNWLSNGQPIQALTGNPTTDARITEDGSYYLNGAMSDAALMAVTRKPTATWVIPTLNEWYKAAYHKNDGIAGDYWWYPASTDSAPSNVLTDPDPGNNANFLGAAYTIGSPYYRTPVGAFANSKSPYGTYDQGGNVGEWNEMIVSFSGGSQRAWNGGSFYWYVGDLRASGFGWYSPTRKLPYIGFRVAYVPEPSALALLAGAAASLLCYACRRMWGVGGKGRGR